ncbi:MAG: carbohydrate kinase family protein [Candidatus Liptonbacteria bacterium]|nr:carbohydrate kinase family protein [Candidatus Liptonbacteria bacterium]
MLGVFRGSFDVIAIGTATRDVFLRSPLFKGIADAHFSEKLGFPSGIAQCFPYGGKIEVERPVVTTGGGAANAAVTFARMGFRTAALFKIGNDARGREIVAELKREGVTPLPVSDAKDETAYSTILLSSSGERSILTYRGASEDMRPADVPTERLHARWAYIAPGGIPTATMKRIVQALKRNKVSIAINPSKRYLTLPAPERQFFFDAASVVILNREEGAYVTGVPYADEEGIFKKMDALVGGIVALTDGANGVSVSDGTHRYRAGIFAERKMVDRTGAGDAFGSGFVSALIGRPTDRAAIMEAIRVGSANATSKVEYVGASEGLLRRADSGSRRWRGLRVSVTPASS